MRVWISGLAVAVGTTAAALATCGAASADADTGPAVSAQRDTDPHPVRENRRAATTTPTQHAATAQTPRRTAHAARVSVRLPPLPLRDGSSFTVSDDAISTRAADYVAAGGDPADSPRFFFGDLAVTSLDALAEPDIGAQQVRQELGSLTASGYFGGIWLRDNLRDTPVPEANTGPGDLTIAALGIRLFDTVAAGLTGSASAPSGWAVRSVAHVSVPVLLALYGYNRGYLEVLLDNPPPGITPAPGSLECDGFLNCSSRAFPLEIATRYDTALDALERPSSPAWWEMRAWTSLLESATGAGRFVWELIARQGSFSPASYEALVELSSAYLMISKAAVLSAMSAYADGDTGLGRSSLRMQAGLWMWSGAYFGGLASGAPPGTLPTISVG